MQISHPITLALQLRPLSLFNTAQLRGSWWSNFDASSFVGILWRPGQRWTWDVWYVTLFLIDSSVLSGTINFAPCRHKIRDRNLRRNRRRGNHTSYSMKSKYLVCRNVLLLGLSNHAYFVARGSCYFLILTDHVKKLRQIHILDQQKLVWAARRLLTLSFFLTRKSIKHKASITLAAAQQEPRICGPVSSS